MGGCASKNKQPKEEPYKPVNPPTEQPQFEEIVAEEKAPVASKPPMKLNGSLTEGEKKKNGPGGVILPNQPQVKDETDPSIPYIDASEDELDDESPSLKKAVQPTVEAAIEPVQAAGIEAVVPELPEVPETPEVPAKQEASEVPEVPKVLETEKILDAKGVDVRGALEATQLTVPTQEVGEVEEDVAVAGDTLNSVELTNDTGESFVDEVLRGVAPQLMAEKSYQSPPIDVEAVTEDVRQDTTEAASSAVASGQQVVEEVVEESLQNGVDAAANITEEVKEVGQPVVEELENINIDASKIIQMGEDSVAEVQPDFEQKEGVQSTEFPGFRVAGKEDTDRIASEEQISMTSESVGVIYSPYCTGRGFRVGDKYIMTAYHLIRDMFDKMAAQGVTSPEQQILDNKEVWIQFEYLQMGEYEFDNPTRFRFASFRYSNPKLDVVIIELQPHPEKTMPPPLINFCGMGKRHMVEFVGHDGSPSKRRQPSNLLEQPAEDEILKAAEWCKNQGFPPRGYDGLKVPNKHRFHGVVESLGAGSPGVVVNNDDVFVVVLLTKGYPSFYLDVDEDQQVAIPNGLKVVEGASMSDVYLDMKDQANLADLCDSVFGLSVSKQKS